MIQSREVVVIQSREVVAIHSREDVGIQSREGVVMQSREVVVMQEGGGGKWGYCVQRWVCGEIVRIRGMKYSFLKDWFREVPLHSFN